MNWYRINLVDGSSGFYEINLSLDKLFEEIEGNHVLKIERTVLLLPHNENGKQGFIAAQRQKMDPMLACCEKENEFICPNNIVSVGVVDVNSEAWGKISENALGESKLIKPKLFVP